MPACLGMPGNVDYGVKMDGTGGEVCGGQEGGRGARRMGIELREGYEGDSRGKEGVGPSCINFFFRLSSDEATL